MNLHFHLIHPKLLGWGKMDEKVHCLQDNVQVKVIVVLEADAVVHPRTMVIKSLHARIANVAMSRVGRANYLTGWAKHVRIEFLDEFQEWHF